jgi:hypothetical protein
MTENGVPPPLLALKALECPGFDGSVEEPRCDTQGADPVTSSPCGAHFVGLAFHVGSPRIWELLALYRNLIRSSRTNFEIGPPPPYWRGKFRLEAASIFRQFLSKQS